MGQSIEGRSDIAARAVVVQPESSQAAAILGALSKAGFRCEHFVDVAGAFAALQKSGADIMVVDLARLSIDPAIILEKLHARSPQAELIVTAPTPLASRAIAAMRAGALDYVTTPVNADELTAIARRVSARIARSRETLLLSGRLEFANYASTFVVESVASRDLVAMVKRAAASESPVLIQSEPGCEKEMVARKLHHWSGRSDGPFVKLGLRAIASQSGVSDFIAEHFERAAGGTIYIDDLADASAEAQIALTTLLEDADAHRRDISGARAAARIVASLTSDRSRDVAASIRSDLFLALNVIPIRLAPLRERAQDIIATARRLLAIHALRFGRVFTISADGEQALLAYQWPGNERELSNVMERAFAMSRGDNIDSVALGVTISRPSVESARATEGPGVVEPMNRSGEAAGEARSSSAAATSAASEEPRPTIGEFNAPQGTLQEWLDRAATVRINAALAQADGDRSRAATLLSIDRTTLTRLMRRLGIG